jgi:aspartate dehydrogenase
MKKIVIVGCGTIGGEVAIAIDRKDINVELTCLYDVDKQKAIALKRRLKNIHPQIAESLKEAVALGDFIFEATHANSLREVAEECFKFKKDLFVMSVGGLILYPEILEKAKIMDQSIFFPSGAIVGLDGIRALRLSGIESVTLKTTKSLKSLMSSPGLNRFLESKNKKVEDITQSVTIFEGNVKEAVPLFPQNVNISAALAINGAGPEKTQVTIVVDPFTDKNVHEIHCISKAGVAFTKTENIPHPQNPKTSYLAILSAISELKRL